MDCKKTDFSLNYLHNIYVFSLIWDDGLNLVRLIIICFCCSSNQTWIHLMFPNYKIRRYHYKYPLLRFFPKKKQNFFIKDFLSKKIFRRFAPKLEEGGTCSHGVFKTVYVSVYKKLDSSMPWVYGMVYETSYFISKLNKLFNLLDTLLSTFEEIIWSESDS